MSFLLMVVGILATALGAILIGFGIPINEFSLGNTLILAGTVTAMGGLIVFAVSRAVSQLTRIADLLAARPAGGVVPAMPAAAPAAPPVVAPPAPRAPKPRAQAQPDELDPPPMVEPVRPAPRSAPPPADEAAPVAPRAGWRPPRPAAERSAERAAKAPGATDPRRAGPASDNPFDAVAQRREPVVEAPASPPAGGRAEAATVLKSGVVDGMAYTLYTDGSIEAELAQGVVRFGSIEELRNHLEKSA